MSAKKSRQATPPPRLPTPHHQCCTSERHHPLSRCQVRREASSPRRRAQAVATVTWRYCQLRSAPTRTANSSSRRCTKQRNVRSSGRERRRRRRGCGCRVMRYRVGEGREKGRQRRGREADARAMRVKEARRRVSSATVELNVLKREERVLTRSRA